MAVRRVRRIIRRFDPWTVLKVSLIFNAIGTMVFILGAWVLWSLVLQRGIPELIATILDTVSVEFTFQGEVYFRIVVFIGLFLGAGLTMIMTLGAIVYNLTADLVGGLEITVLEETYQVTATPGQSEVPVRAPRRPLIAQLAQLTHPNGSKETPSEPKVGSPK